MQLLSYKNKENIFSYNIKRDNKSLNIKILLNTRLYLSISAKYSYIILSSCSLKHFLCESIHYFNVFINSLLFNLRIYPSILSIWCWKEESNPQPTDYDSVALPIELFQHGCPNRIRTYDAGVRVQSLTTWPWGNYYLIIIFFQIKNNHKIVIIQFGGAEE